MEWKLKANNGKGNTPKRDLWETKQEFWDVLDEQYHFEFDCCASNDNKKTLRFSNDFNQMKQYHFEDFPLCCWMNPPFSKAFEMFEHFFKVVKQGVAIYRCDNLETRLWQKVILVNCSWIFIPNKRISYDGLDGDGARFPSALIGFNVSPPKVLKGTLLKVIEDEL